MEVPGAGTRCWQPLMAGQGRFGGLDFLPGKGITIIIVQSDI